MLTGSKFWLTMAVFQMVFGLTVYTATRLYYVAASIDAASAARPRAAAPSPWPDVGLTAPSAASPTSATLGSDPLAIANQADTAFTSKQYDQAAELYAQLLQLDLSNVDLYNNLGITLHYLGRSEEALRRLAEGAALDPQHQRIWLTTGFVNLQLGNTERARIALTNAASVGTDASIRASAEKMLASLP
jgi:tetratricopeptide (TPR) repeat protein